MYIYIRPHQTPLFFKFYCSRGENVPYHEKIVSEKYKRNWFIFEGGTKSLKNAIFLTLYGKTQHMC